MTSEMWRSLPGYEGYYEVSDLGRVRSLNRTVIRSGHQLKLKGQVLIPRICKSNGYAYVNINKDGVVKHCTVHRLVATAFLFANPNDALSVGHINGKRADNRLLNLRLNSQGERKPDGSMCKGGHPYRRRLRYSGCLTCHSQKNLRWYNKNREKQKQKMKEWKLANPNKISAQPSRTKEVFRAAATKYRAKHCQTAKYKEKMRAQNQRRATTPIEIACRRLRIRLRAVIRNKKRKTFDLLGYSPDEFRTHIERQFVKGMSWSNAKEWHIDHIRPISSFSFNGPDDPLIRVAFGLANMRPIWAFNNLSKGAKREFLL